MEEIIELLENWKNLSVNNPILEKDYFIDQNRGTVHLSIAISVESGFLYKTLTAVCSVDIHGVENAIEALEESKDGLI